MRPSYQTAFLICAVVATLCLIRIAAGIYEVNQSIDDFHHDWWDVNMHIY